MKYPSAITSQALASVAGRKTRRVQEKLHEAETEMHAANEELAMASAPSREAVARNVEAERKVHEAVEELEVVKEMLDNADVAAPTHNPSGASGHGVKSLLPHLRRRA